MNDNLDNLPLKTPYDKEKNTRNVAYVIYFLYLFSLPLPVLEFVAIIFAYIFENDGSPLLKTHYQYLIRTFWIGLLYFGISTILCVVLIGFILLPLCALWLIIRVIKGIKSLMHNEPIANPTTWLW